MALQNFLGMKLSQAEETALILWAEHEGINNKSTMMRRLFRLALRNNAPRAIFSPELLKELHLTQKAKG